MLEPDVREQDDARLQDVRRVVASAEARFDDCDVHLSRGEERERGSGHDLELGGVEPFRGRANTRDRVLEVRLLAVEANPLAPALDVG